jgi:peptide/nickel transport system permease protein
VKSYLLRRLWQAVLVLFGVSVVVFLILHLTGDPAALLLPPDATADDIARFRKAMGFDDPVAVQYLRFLKGALRGDFGESLRHGEPAMTLVLERLPATFSSRERACSWRCAWPSLPASCPPSSATAPSTTSRRWLP